MAALPSPPSHNYHTILKVMLIACTHKRAYETEMYTHTSADVYVYTQHNCRANINGIYSAWEFVLSMHLAD
jgi:hypothetical protein